MINIKKIETLNELSELKKDYFEKATTPLDGMWHFGFVPMANHYGFYIADKLIGFCAINDDGYLLQFHLQPNRHTSAQILFTLITEQQSAVIGTVKGAFVSTAEPEYLSLCLDHSSTFNVHSLMYQHIPELFDELDEPIELLVAREQQLAEFVGFAVDSIGAPEQWLNGYYANLIKRNELFGYWSDGKLLAAGECRLFDDYQTEYADLGMIVAQSVRGQGIAKRVLNYLTKHATELGLKSICSTESGNVGAQKAMLSTGFISGNRIVQFEFDAS